MRELKFSEYLEAVRVLSKSHIARARRDSPTYEPRTDTDESLAAILDIYENDLNRDFIQFAREIVGLEAMHDAVLGIRKNIIFLSRYGCDFSGGAPYFNPEDN